MNPYNYVNMNCQCILCLAYRTVLVQLQGSSSVRQAKFGISDKLVQANRCDACSLGVVFPHDPHPSKVRDAEEPIPSSCGSCAFSVFTLHSFHSDRQDTNACTSFNASLRCTSDTNGCNTSHAGSTLYKYLVRVCSIQATSKEYRIPHVSWSNSQGSRLIGKTRAGKLRKKRKTRAKGEERGKGRGMPHSLNNHQSLKKDQEKSEAQHFRLAEGC